jgi:SAM-dependent methyltransferase
MPASTSKPQLSILNRLLFHLLSIPREGPEISDRIVAFDSDTLARQPVLKQEVIREFESLNRPDAVRVIEKLPADSDGMLNSKAVDDLLVTVHCEMQRISEEFQHGRRMSQLLGPLLEAVRSGKSDGRALRVVDIGCGTGFVLRWLAAHNAVPDDVELIGADYNAALIEEARRLASIEDLRCRFVVANAFHLDQPAAIYISTGILHHFRGAHLNDLLAQQAQPHTRAFLHFDFHQTAIAPFGSWLFHEVRMRQPLAWYDGILSAVRAYRAEELLAAARAAVPSFHSAVYGIRLWGLPIPRAFHSLIGIRPEYREAFHEKLGSKANSLGVLE